jgi:hypothetical protein
MGISNSRCAFATVAHSQQSKPVLKRCELPSKKNLYEFRIIVRIVSRLPTVLDRESCQVVGIRRNGHRRRGPGTARRCVTFDNRDLLQQHTHTRTPTTTMTRASRPNRRHLLLLLPPPFLLLMPFLLLWLGDVGSISTGVFHP